MDIKIMVAAHKPYWMPQDDVYMPIHVGCEGKESIGFTGDNTGDNISAKNPHYGPVLGLEESVGGLRRPCPLSPLLHQ